MHNKKNIHLMAIIHTVHKQSLMAMLKFHFWKQFLCALFCIKDTTFFFRIEYQPCDTYIKISEKLRWCSEEILFQCKKLNDFLIFLFKKHWFFDTFAQITMHFEWVRVSNCHECPLTDTKKIPILTICGHLTQFSGSEIEKKKIPYDSYEN